MQTNKPTKYKITFFSPGENMPVGDPPPFKGLLEQYQKNLRMKQMRNWLGAGIGIVLVVTAGIYSYMLDKDHHNEEKANPVIALNNPGKPSLSTIPSWTDSSIASREIEEINSANVAQAQRDATYNVHFVTPTILNDSLPNPFTSITTLHQEGSMDNIDLGTTESPKIRTIKAPYKIWDVKYQKFHVNADSTSVIIMPTGTKFTIPPHSLVDANGNIIKGNVQIVCREFFDPVDIALAGVPMTYDSAGKQYQLETAGMFEIKGYYQGKPIHLSEGKTIKVSQASLGDDTYNTYYLDTVAGKWTYKGRPVSRRVGVNSGNDSKTGSKIKVEGVSEVSDRRINTKKFTSRLSDREFPSMHAQMPKPKLRDIKNQGFKVPVDTLLFPELAGLKNMIFEIAPGQPKIPNNKWVKMYIKRGNMASAYTLVLVKGKSEYPYSAYPAFAQGEDYDNAMEVYKQYYQDILLQQGNTDSMTRISRNRALEGALIIEAKRKERVNAGQPTVVTGRINDVEVWREFSISNFGMWNCDKMISFPQVERLNVKISIPGQASADLADVNVLAKRYNSIWLRHPMAGGMYQIEYDKGDDIFLFAILPGSGKIAILDTDEFIRQRALIRSGAQQDLQMKLVDESFANSREVKAYILTMFLVDN